jgi:uncharacterized membrane protein YgaE (UPF0421/DUF939 family)
VVQVAANLNTDLNLNPLIERILDNPYGVAVVIGIVVLALVIILFFSISKSGILTTLREHQEYKARRVKEEIKDQEDLLEDEEFKKYKHQIKYHLDVLKLNKLLKYSHHDKDLLEYILSCKNSHLAMIYYDSAKSYIEKDENTKQFKLKKYCHPSWIKLLNGLGTLAYFVICFGTLYPTGKIFYIAFTTGASLKGIPISFVASQFLLFVLGIILGMMVLAPMIKPWKAMRFLELEKIESDLKESIALDEAA